MGDRLFVSLGNNNAVALYRLRAPTTVPEFSGLVPTASYPSAVALDRGRAQLVVPNLRGVGSVADADADRSARGVGGEVGSVSLIPVPSDDALLAGTAQVARNNGWDNIDTSCGREGVPARAVPERIGEPSTIEGDRRYLSEESMALLTPPAPTLLEPKPAAPTTASRKEIRYGIVALRAEQHATSYTSPGDAIQPRGTSS